MVANRQAGSENEESASPAVTLRPAAFGDPFRWLALGTRDFVRAPGGGLLFGPCCVAMGRCPWRSAAAVSVHKRT